MRATKKYSIKTAPNILVVNLKRFDFTYAGKLSHFVTYPEMLSLKTFLTDSETKLDFKQLDENDSSPNSTNFYLKNVSYKLYGVLVHLGYTSHSGHYYSYVRGPNDVWYKADDQQMSTVRLQDALSQNAYILFYNRVAPQQMTPPPPPPLTPLPTQAPLPILTPSITPAVKLVNFDNSNLASCPSINDTSTKAAQTVEETGPKATSNIPEIKFKSTFVPVDSVEPKHQTLDYEQVLEIKRLNKRKLKLVDNKKKLRELKRQKRHTDSHEDEKSLKKQIRKLKKLIRKQKSKIKRLEKSSKGKSDLKASSSSSSSSSSGSSSCEETSGAVSRKRKLTDGNTNSLSLLKQYASCSSSSSSSSSEDEAAPSKKSIRLSSSRSSSTSDSSTLSTSSSSEANKKDCVQLAVATKPEQSLQVIHESNTQECLPDQDKKPANDVFVYLKETSLSAVKKWNNSTEDKNKLNDENSTDESTERHVSILVWHRI